jgi:hypothetical protein
MLRILAPFVLALLTGCASQTLFQSGFDGNALGAPPSHAQPTGTVDTGGVVRIATAPPGASGRWVELVRPNNQSDVADLRCSLSQLRGDGTYGVLGVLFIPAGTGFVTVEFDGTAFGPNPIGFLHLDFRPDGTVRVNDDDRRFFGHFPHDQFFTLSVTLDIGASAQVAHVSLLGSGTSGSLDIPLDPAQFSHQFGMVRVFIGTPHTGSVKATDILVTRRTP